MRQSFSSDHNLKPATGAVALLIGTRKGAFILRGDRTRRSWKFSKRCSWATSRTILRTIRATEKR